MYTVEYNCFTANKISLNFICDHCGSTIQKTFDRLPNPNFLTEKDTFESTKNQDETYVECDYCNKKFDLVIQASCSGGFLYIENLNEDSYVEINEYSDEIEESLSFNDSEKRKLYPIDALKVEKSTYSIFELKRKYDRKLIRLDADFQRDDVWKPKQKIELIESILMGLPLPIFYFNRDKNGVLIVADGRQRLTAMFQYMDDKFPLKGLKVLSSDFEKKFSELGQFDQSKIEDYQILTYEIMPETPESVIFDIFDRVNRGGTKLNKQEIRNALYKGNSTILLKEYVKSDLFKEITGKGLEKDKRQKAQYLLLRFIAFYIYRTDHLLDEDNELYVYKNIEELLSLTMKKINLMSERDLIKLKFHIDFALSNVQRYTDCDVFRLKVNGTKTPINMNVFETVMYIMALIPMDLPRQQVEKKINLLKSSSEFQENIGNYRDSEIKVKQRFEMADSIVKELLK